jgi:anti-anti-sigma factor
VQLTTDRTTSATVVRIEGEMDFANQEQLRRELAELPDDLPVEIDCAGVSFVDSSGLSELVRLGRRLMSSGSTIRLTNTRQPLRRLLELTGLVELLNPD